MSMPFRIRRTVLRKGGQTLDISTVHHILYGTAAQSGKQATATIANPIDGGTQTITAAAFRNPLLANTLLGKVDPSKLRITEIGGTFRISQIGESAPTSGPDRRIPAQPGKYAARSQPSSIAAMAQSALRKTTHRA